METVVVWVGIVVVFLVSVVGWVITYIRNTKSHSREFGELTGVVKGLGDRISGLEINIADLNIRIDNILTNMPTKRRRKKPE